MQTLKPYLLAFALIVVRINSYAQTEIPRDTTYTVWSTYQKVKKQYPQVAVVKPLQSPSITQRFDVPYITVENNGGRRELKADLFYPKKIKQKLPGVVLVHGGGWRSGDKSMNT